MIMQTDSPLRSQSYPLLRQGKGVRCTALAVLTLFIGLLQSGAAHAGRSCETNKPSTHTVEQGLTLAERTANALDASGHRVVFLARSGQDLRKYGLRYSHLGIAYRQSDGQGGEVWRVIHKLNHCGTAEAALYRQGLGEFFLDDLWRFEAAYSAPSPEVQDRLIALLKDDRRAVALNHKPYSIVSYAWSQRYQQSNQWLIETMAAAMAPTVYSRAQAQAWLRFQGYEPTPLRLGPLTRLGGRMTAANVAFDDHPNAQRFADRIETVTADSVFSWLERAGLGKAPVAIRLFP
jgi:hypothetical protein